MCSTLHRGPGGLHTERRSQGVQHIASCLTHTSTTLALALFHCALASILSHPTALSLHCRPFLATPAPSFLLSLVTLCPCFPYPGTCFTNAACALLGLLLEIGFQPGLVFLNLLVMFFPGSGPWILSCRIKSVSPMRGHGCTWLDSLDELLTPA